MTAIDIVVNGVGLSLIAFIVWYFWLSERQAVRVGGDGEFQEARIAVKGGYSPDVIVVGAHKPVRLHFTRLESSACSEMVVFGDLDKSASLPEGQPVTLELGRLEPGEYNFACQMGMLRGKLVVEDP